MVTKVAKREGLKVKVVEFNDYVQPNAALDAGDLDANKLPAPAVSRQPDQAAWLQDRQRGPDVHFADRLLFEEVQVAEGLPQGAKVGMPERSVERQSRAVAAAEEGVIKLKAGAGTNGNNATPLDVAENPKKIKLVELDAAQLPRSLDDLDAAVDQHELRAERGPAADKRRDRDRRSQGPLREPDRRARAGQGQAVGQETGRRL